MSLGNNRYVSYVVVLYGIILLIIKIQIFNIYMYGIKCLQHLGQCMFLFYTDVKSVYILMHELYST